MDISKNIENINFSILKYINLESNFLEKFPKELFQLNNLENINLSENYITEIPNDIIKLQKLKELNIENNLIGLISRKIIQIKSLFVFRCDWIDSHNSNFLEKFSNFLFSTSSKNRIQPVTILEYIKWKDNSENNIYNEIYKKFQNKKNDKILRNIIFDTNLNALYYFIIHHSSQISSNYSFFFNLRILLLRI